MLDLYQQQIIDRYKHPQFAGPLAGATHTAEGANLSCGDEIRLELIMDGDIVQQIRHTSRACAVCSASADLLAEALINQKIGAVEPEAHLETLHIPLSPIRRKCALLPLETLKNLEQA